MILPNLNPCTCGTGKPMRRMFQGKPSGGERLYSVFCSMRMAKTNKKCTRSTKQFATVAEAASAWNTMNPEA